MKAEILSTGDEVCFGSIVDSNAAHIAAVLSDLGIEVTRHTCVGDDLQSLVAILNEIRNRADIAVITGGLGPTTDDLTAEAVGEVAGVRLVFDQTAVVNIEKLFAKFSRKMAESDMKQAMLPEGAIPMYNIMGTAPGFILNIGKCRCYFLPGVPREMERMLSDQVIPDINLMQGRGQAKSQTFMMSVFGLPEAVVNDRLKSISSVYPAVKLGMIARFPIVYVKLTISGNNANSIEDDARRAKAWASEKLGDNVFSAEGNTMEAEVGALIKKHRLTVGVAESCTGGLISNLLTNIPGSSDYFLMSAVTYANQAKTNILGVSPETITTYGAVHEETAKEMAIGIQRVSGAAIGLSVTGIAGPTGATPDKPVGTLCIGIAMPTETITRRFVSPFQERLSNKQIFAICALDTLRKQILKST